MNPKNTNPIEPQADDKDETLGPIHEAFSQDVDPNLEKRMHESMEHFRQELREHPYVRQLERRTRKGWRYLRLSIRYALLSVLLLLAITSATQAGRQMLADRMAKVYLLVDELGKMQMRGESKTYNALMDKADAVAPATIEDACLEQVLGLSPDRTSIILLVMSNKTEGWAERGSSACLWSVDLDTGLVTPVQKGKIIDVCLQSAYSQRGVLRSLLYIVRPKHVRMKTGSTLLDLPPNEQLWLYDFKKPPTLIAEGPIADQWYGLSSDTRSLFYTKIPKASQTTIIYDIDNQRHQEWKSDSGIAVGWTEDSLSIIAMTQTVTDALSLASFRRISANRGNVLDQLDVSSLFSNRGMLGNPEFASTRFFSVTTRDHKYFTESHEDRVDVFSVNPLRHVASIPGTGLNWTPDGTRAIVRKPSKALSPLVVKQVKDEKGQPTTIISDFDPKEGQVTDVLVAGLSTVIGVFDTTTGLVTDIDLAKLQPAFDGPGPGPFYVGGDPSAAVSPDSRYLTLQAKWGFGLLDLESHRVARAFEGFFPSAVLWSPDSRRIAVRGRYSAEQEFQAYIIDTETGAIKDLGFKHMMPVAWLDEKTAVWINRWAGQDPKVVGPFCLTITNLETGEKRDILLHDSKP